MQVDFIGRLYSSVWTKRKACAVIGKNGFEKVVFPFEKSIWPNIIAACFFNVWKLAYYYSFLHIRVVVIGGISMLSESQSRINRRCAIVVHGIKAAFLISTIDRLRTFVSVIGNDA